MKVEDAKTQAGDPVAVDSEPPSDSSVKLSGKSRRRTRREADAWEPLLTSQPTKEAPSSLETIPQKLLKTSQPPAPKVSRKERLLEQARSQARERVLQQVALRTREPKPIDLEKPNLETLRESVVALLQDSKVDAKSQGDAIAGSESEDRSTAGDKPVVENPAAPAKEKFWNLVGKWL